MLHRTGAVPPRRFPVAESPLARGGMGGGGRSLATWRVAETDSSIDGEKKSTFLFCFYFRFPVCFVSCPFFFPFRGGIVVDVVVVVGIRDSHRGKTSALIVKLYLS